MIRTSGTHWKKQWNNKELNLLMQILTGKIAISLYLLIKKKMPQTKYCIFQLQLDCINTHLRVLSAQEEQALNMFWKGFLEDFPPTFGTLPESKRKSICLTYRQKHPEN